MDFRRFAIEVSGFSNRMLEAKERCDTHWQIWHNGKCLVDVWPTTNKYREANLKSGSAARKGDPYVAINRALEIFQPTVVARVVEKQQDAGTVKVALSREYLEELKSKVEYGFNLLNEEARHLFAHAGILIPKHKRCQRCNNDGTIKTTIPGTTTFETEACPVCRGRRGSSQTESGECAIKHKLQWSFDGKGRWIAGSGIHKPKGFDRPWIIKATQDGLFSISDSYFDMVVDNFKTLPEAQEYCQKQTNRLHSPNIESTETTTSEQRLLSCAYELLKSVTVNEEGRARTDLPGSLQMATDQTIWHTWMRLTRRLMTEMELVFKKP